MKRRTLAWLLAAGAVVLVLGAGGLLVALSGIVPIKASSGHWAVTEWLLQLGKRRSVATHTLGMEPLDLSAPWLVLKGAGHYESGCRPCHGSPDFPTPRIAAAMTPLPPYLPSRVEEWDPEELFYIVKHGIKFTGMPAWRAQGRDDEVVAMVAFLLALPDLDARAYDALVQGEAPEARAVVPLEDIPELDTPPEAVVSSCARCHGIDGLGRGNAAFPKLAGQRGEYLYETLQAYAAGERHSGIMEPIAAGLSQVDRRVLARYYASRPSGAGAAEPDTSDVEAADAAEAGATAERAGVAGDTSAVAGSEAATAAGGTTAQGDTTVTATGDTTAVADASTPATTALPAGDTSSVIPPSGGPADPERGREIASVGDPELGVPSCMDCHGPAPHEHNPMYPRLTGQYADYLVLQLELFKNRQRGGSDLSEIMHHVVDGLDEQQMRDVALYYAGLPVTEDEAR